MFWLIGIIIFLLWLERTAEKELEAARLRREFERVEEENRRQRYDEIRDYERRFE